LETPVPTPSSLEQRISVDEKEEEWKAVKSSYRYPLKLHMYLTG
jgi:hypothetical protein